MYVCVCVWNVLQVKLNWTRVKKKEMQRTTITVKTNIGAEWKKIKKIKRKCNSSPASYLKINNTRIHNPLEITQQFPDHFSSICKTITNCHHVEYARSSAKFKKVPLNRGHRHQDNQFLWYAIYPEWTTTLSFTI